MKYLCSCLVALPLIASCVEQNPYEQNYYAPPARVEVHQDDYTNRHYHNNNGYHRPATPQGRIIHGHNGHHGHSDLNQNKVIVNPPPSQVHVHGKQNIHGHGGNNGNVVRHPSVNGGSVVVPGKAHGHDNGNNKSRQPEQSGDAPATSHGHN